MMLTTVFAAVALLQVPSSEIQAGRYEAGERTKALDVAWQAASDPAVRGEAIPHIQKAVQMFFGMRLSEVCQNLDLAIAALEKRPVRAADAINARFFPPIVEPGQQARLQFSWAYAPSASRIVTIKVQGKEIKLSPTKREAVWIDPSKVNTELRRSPEQGILVPVQIGDDQRSAYLSIAKNFRERVDRLRNAQNPSAKAYYDLIQKAMLQPTAMETDIPAIQLLFQAEQFEDGRIRPETMDDIYWMPNGNFPFRANFPPNFSANDATVVIAFHGAGATPNMWFEAYGGGVAVKEATKRGWAFIAPVTKEGAAQAVLDWLKTQRGVRVSRVFIMGHSLGGGQALGSAKVTPKPAAIAAFSPAASRFGKDFEEIPLLLTIGKQEISRLLVSTQALAREMASMPSFKYIEYDQCEHLMLPAVCMKDAYAFFDASAKQKAVNR